MTEIAYRPLTAAENISKALFWDTICTAALVKLFAPVLAIPVIGPVFRSVYFYFTDAIFEAGRLFVDMTAIKFVNAAHQSAYEKASIHLRVIAHESGTDSEEFKKGRENAKEYLARFVSFGGR